MHIFVYKIPIGFAYKKALYLSQNEISRLKILQQTSILHYSYCNLFYNYFFYRIVKIVQNKGINFFPESFV